MMKNIIIAVMTAAVMTAVLINVGRKGFLHKYGVFVGSTVITRDMKEYEILVIDALNFKPEEIVELKAQGHTVYSYLNIGSVEEFRDCYNDYKDLSIGKYENWDELWVDVGSERWQSHIKKYSEDILKTGADGFFLDNADVYDVRSSESIYTGLCRICADIRESGAYVIINGGDGFVKRYAAEHGELKSLADAVNQEGVFSRIDFSKNTLTANDKETKEYFCEYISEVKKYGLEVFTVEYTENAMLSSEIEEYSRQNGFITYITDDVTLGAGER